MNQVFIDIYNTIWKEVFPNIPPMELEKFKKLYTADLALPKKYQCALSAADIYCNPDYGYKRFISDEERAKRMELNNHMEPKIEVASLVDVLKKTNEIAMFRGNKTVNSDVVETSDNIYSSSYVYNSFSIHSAQKILFCNGLGPCEYMMACKESKDSNFCIRVMDSGSVTNSFDVSFSGKCSNCYFCHNCYDLRDCMFCFHIESKQFCIANMQFEEEEYRRLKEKILMEYFAQLDNPKAFVSLKDL